MVTSEVWAAGKQTSVYNITSLQHLSGENNQQAHIIHVYVRGGLYIILFDAHSKNMRAYWFSTLLKWSWTLSPFENKILGFFFYFSSSPCLLRITQNTRTLFSKEVLNLLKWYPRVQKHILYGDDSHIISPEYEADTLPLTLSPEKKTLK